jgi:putative CocE/NonD family hydrolase
MITRGYVQVIVDVRGTGASEGNWDSFGEREKRDGFELAEWVASHERPWSDGRVGLHGTSYAAINQIFTASQQPDGVKATFPIVPASDTYRDIAVTGGQSDTSFIPSWLGLVTGLGLIPPTYAAQDPIQAARVLAQHAGNVFAFQGNVVLDAMNGGDMAFDGPFYRTRSPIEAIDRVKVPTFIVGGWFDLFQRGEPMNYERLRKNKVPTRFVMGPWYHITAGQGLPAEGVAPLDQLELRWFDHYVRGADDPSLDTEVPPVQYFENGEGHWHTATGWPFPDVGWKALKLTTGGKLGDAPGSGGPDTLYPNPTTGACSRSTVQWSAGAGEDSPCETDHRLNDATSLSYDLEVGSKALRIGGPIAAKLFLATDRNDGLITARLEDVAADGKSTQLSAGWQVLSLRALDEAKSRKRQGFMVQPYHPFTKESRLPVEPGKPMEVDLEIFPTAASFAPGHKLRLTLQSADAPHLTAPLPQGLDSLGGTLTVYHDATHPSQVVIPVRDAAPKPKAKPKHKAKKKKKKKKKKAKKKKRKHRKQHRR